MQFKPLTLEGDLKLRLYPQLKLFRKLQSRGKSHYVLNLPIEWINGSASEKVSLQLAQSDKDLFVLVNLSEWGRTTNKAREQNET